MAQLTGPPAPPATTVGDAFGWAARDPEWISKLLLMGLIGLIPVVGALQQAGWLLTMLDNLRAGRSEVPPAGFRYATRGVWLWLAGVIYGLVFFFVFYGLTIAFFIAVTASAPPGSGDQASAPNPAFFLVFPLLFVWIGFIGIASIVLWIFVPAIIEFTDRSGLGGAFNIPGLFRAVTRDPTHNLAAAGLSFVAYLISSLGTYLCWIGVIFTLPYAITVLAGVLRWYEVNIKPDTLPAKSVP